MTRLLPLLAIMALFLASVSVAYAQTTTPTVSTVVVTSDPGTDLTYALGDTIEVGLTFGEAVTVTGDPYLLIDVGGTNRRAGYQSGSGTTQLLFQYTVLTGDDDDDGIAVVANSLTLNGGTIVATDAASIEGGMRLMAHVARLVVPALGLNPDRTVFAPALHSSETHADPEGVLASMARRCAEAAGGRCLPGLLEKEPHLPTGRGGLDPEFRILLVEDAAYRSTCSGADAVFIVDDFIATGKTLSRRHRHSGPGTRHQRVRTGPGQAGMA